jgi:hypothetical protein
LGIKPGVFGDLDEGCFEGILDDSAAGMIILQLFGKID